MNAQTHYINIGIDLGIKAKNCAQIRDENGRKIEHDYSFYTTKEALDKICAKAQATSPEAKIRLIIEAIRLRRTWFPVAIYGKTHNHSVTRVKTQKVGHLRKVYDQHNKYDKLDTKTLIRLRRNANRRPRRCSGSLSGTSQDLCIVSTLSTTRAVS